MNSNALADHRIPLLDRIGFAADLLHTGTGPACLVVSSAHAKEGWTEARIVSRALSEGWVPPPVHSGTIDPRRWLNAVISASWVSSALRIEARSALAGKRSGERNIGNPVLIFAFTPSECTPDANDCDGGIEAALSAGWEPTVEQITEALNYDPSLAERWPVMKRFVKAQPNV